MTDSKKIMVGVGIIALSVGVAYYLTKKDKTENIPPSAQSVYIETAPDYLPNDVTPSSGKEVPTAPSSSTPINVGSKKSSSGKVSTEYISNVTETKNVFNPTATDVTVKTNTGKTATVTFPAGSYSEKLGIGYSSSGQGYSSISPLKR